MFPGLPIQAPERLCKVLLTSTLCCCLELMQSLGDKKLSALEYVPSASLGTVLPFCLGERQLAAKRASTQLIETNQLQSIYQQREGLHTKMPSTPAKSCLSSWASWEWAGALFSLEGKLRSVCDNHCMARLGAGLCNALLVMPEFLQLYNRSWVWYWLLCCDW